MIIMKHFPAEITLARLMCILLSIPLENFRTQNAYTKEIFAFDILQTAKTGLPFMNRVSYSALKLSDTK